MLCKTFVLKTYEDKKFPHQFKLNENKSKTKSKKPKLKHIYTQAKIFEKFPIPYLTKYRIGNGEKKKECLLYGNLIIRQLRNSTTVK